MCCGKRSYQTPLASARRSEASVAALLRSALIFGASMLLVIERAIARQASP